MRHRLDASEIPPLPAGLSITKIYADMLRWLVEHTKHFFRTHTIDGEQIWQRLGSQVTIVLAIPNGWEVEQQHVLRQAMQMSGILPVNFDEDRLEFVTEGEASVHYALHHIRNTDWLAQDAMFALTDAGGSTVDSTLYVCKQATPSLQLEEACPSECVQAGSVFVDRAMQRILEERLVGSRFDSEEEIEEMIKIFEEVTKREFGDRNSEYIIRFGGMRDNDPAFNIMRGRLTLSREEIAPAFADVVNIIEESCSRLLSDGNVNVSPVQAYSGAQLIPRDIPVPALGWRIRRIPLSTTVPQRQI
jgi:hypothetical protein